MKILKNTVLHLQRWYIHSDFKDLFCYSPNTTLASATGNSAPDSSLPDTFIQAELLHADGNSKDRYSIP